MLIKQVGSSGLKVSNIGLGTLTWGRDIPEDECAKQLDIFIENGGSLIDTAPNYGSGYAEKILGSLLSEKHSRSNFVLSAKSGIKFTQNGSHIDISKKTLLENLDSTLENLNTDYLDVWFVSQPDFSVPFYEIAQTLDYAISTGRVRYVGLSNFPSWAVVQINELLSDTSRLKNITAVQMEYSLLERGIEKNLVPAVEYNNIGVFAWSPLGRGVLTGKYISDIPLDSRGASTHLFGFVEPYLNEVSAHIVEGLKTASQGLDLTIPQVALQWVLQKSFISSAIVGPRTCTHLNELLSVDKNLPSQIVEALDIISNTPTGYPDKF